MPTIWNKTIEAHRREVRDAILHTTAALVAQHGLTSVTMSQIAENTGIGRATLYKYFPGVEEILLAWHEEQINRHLLYLTEVRDGIEDPALRLEAVLEAYALISHESHGHRDTELGAFLHRDRHLVSAQHELHALVRDLLSRAAEVGAVRTDVSTEELANYCLHALSASGGLRSKAAVHRLVSVTVAGLDPRPGS